MSSGLVSVLMPVFNAQRYVEAAVSSIINQSYTNWELIILNDGSTDDTSSIINQFSDPRIKVMHQSENSGYLVSCNKLFELAQGDFVTFLDADDMCDSCRLEKCVKAFIDNPSIGFLTTNYTRISEDGSRLESNISNIDYQRYASDYNYAPIICCATIFLRADLLKEVGGYRSFFADIGGEDYHWLFRLSLKSSGMHLASPLYHYRRHPAQTHHKNQNPLKYFYSDIDREIRKSILEHGIDPLQGDNDLKKRWLMHIDANPQELQFRIASSLLNLNQHLAAISKGFTAITLRPFSLTSWQRFAYLTYSALMR